MRKSLSYVLLFAVFNALSDGQASHGIGDTLNRRTTASPGSGTTAPPESQLDSQSVACNGNQLRITPHNSTLASVLAEVEKCTGAKIVVPEGAATKKVFNVLGPGPIREVLASLLSSNDFDYVIGSSTSDPDKVETVLLIPHQVDVATAAPPASSSTAANDAGPQPGEDGLLTLQTPQVSLPSAPSAPEAAAGGIPATELVETASAGTSQTSAISQPSAQLVESPAILVSSKSTAPTVNPVKVKPTVVVARARMYSNGVINQARWRDELTRFGISADTSDERLTYVAAAASVNAAHQGLTWYPVNSPSIEDNLGTAEAPTPILLPAVVTSQMPQGELASIGNENGGVIGSSFYDPMEKYPVSYFADATAGLNDRAKSPMGYPVLTEQPGEESWQVDRRLAIIVPLTLMILILLCQVFVTSFVRARIFLLAVPLSAIGAMWSLCLYQSNSAAVLWMGIIGLLSIQAEAGVFRLLHLERANERAKSRADLEGDRRSELNRYLG